MQRIVFLFIGASALFLTACGDDGANHGPDGDLPPSCPPTPPVIGDGVDLGQPVRFEPCADPSPNLSDYNLFAWDAATGTFTYNERVVPYDMNTELFTDYALKARAVYVPEGSVATYEPKEVLEFPVGTVLIKNFYYPADFQQPDQELRLIETRLYVHRPTGWEGLPYVWNEEGTDAAYLPAGKGEAIAFVDRYGESVVANYLVPQKNQCRQCHERFEPDPASGIVVQTPIGPKARYLNRTRDFGGDVGERNQLEYLAELGMLTGVPDDLDGIERAFDFRQIVENGHDELDDVALNKASRDYLDINCAHCHNPNHSQGVTSQLFLNYDNTSLFNLGVCKRPGSAGDVQGRTHDIVPGDPDASILNFRIESVTPGQMMPLLARSLRHAEGTDLVREWVARMDPVDCAAIEP
jgi:uncharacterized repeat protein (TIGR03806 family)